MTLIISFCIDLLQYMALLLSSHGSLDKNLINHGRFGKRYNFKFVTCGSENLSIGGTRNKNKSSKLVLSKKVHVF
ncbi:hypothetical protein CR513_39462, partial [Mucuna pruriens]